MSRLYDMRGYEVAETKRKTHAEKISRAKHFENEFICSSLVSEKDGIIEGEAVDSRHGPNNDLPTDLWLDKKTFVVAKVDK